MTLSPTEIASRILKLPPDQQKLATKAFKMHFEGKIVSPKLEAEREYYLTHPIEWMEKKLGATLWSKQKEIVNSVLYNRRTAVQSCFSGGKSFIAAALVCWWIDCHKPGTARVVTSAPTGDQVRAILWHEIGRAHSKANLLGRVNQTEWWLPIKDREELVAIGRKPNDYSPTSFQGIHEEYVLVVLDEAAGISKPLYDAVAGLLANEKCRLLSIGNPEDATSEFANECKPGSGANAIRISAFDTPNFTGEEVPDSLRSRLVSRIWVEERKQKWGESSPMYQAKVLGLFPESSTDGLIPISWIRLAQERNLSRSYPIELGVDVGGGNNANVIACRYGDFARIIHEDTNPDTMVTLSNTLQCIELTSASRAKVDYIGIGHGAVDRAKEIASDQQIIKDTPLRAQHAGKIVGVEVGRTARDSEHYANLRAEGYWNLRERFREGTIDIDPTDEDLAAQLSAIKYKPVSGRIQIESKKEMRDRSVSSPDKADALMLAYLDVESGEDDWITF